MKVEWILTIVSIVVSAYATTVAVSAYSSVNRLSKLVEKLLEEMLRRNHDLDDDCK